MTKDEIIELIYDELQFEIYSTSSDGSDYVYGVKDAAQAVYKKLLEKGLIVSNGD